MEQSEDVSEENLSQYEYNTPKSNEVDRGKVIPIRMIRAIIREEPLQEGIYVANANIHQGDMVSVRDTTPTEEEPTSNGNTDRYLDSSEGYDFDNSIVPEEELKKIRVLLRGRIGVDMKIPLDKQKQKFCKSHRKFCKQALKEKKEKEKRAQEDIAKEHFEPPEIPPEFEGKNKFLYYVGAKDCIKEEVKRQYGFQLV